MVCDSTNATVEGHSTSEAALYSGLLDVIGPATGRVVVTCFGSNIARLHTLAMIARATGRYMGLIGRSLINMSAAAKATGLWDAADSLINASHFGYLPRDEVLAVATGSQGEPRTALRRLAEGNHPDFELEAGDLVIFSARAIPGNEEAIEALIARLRAMGVEVMTTESARLPIHASGHPAQDELKAMYEWVQPAVAIPVHGEEIHMQTHADIARDCGVPKRLVGRNGDLFMIRPVPGMRRQIAETGRLGWEKQELVRVF